MNGAFRPKGGNGVHGLCNDETEGLMQSSWISCAKSGYSRTNLPLRKEKRPPGAISFVSRRKIWKKGVPKDPLSFGISADCAANAFALTYRCFRVRIGAKPEF